MQDSDIDMIVSKVTEHFASRINSAHMDEFQELVAEDAEKERQYLEWKRQSHAEHILKIVLWWILGVILAVGLGAWLYFARQNEMEQISKRDARLEQQKLEDERFNARWEQQKLEDERFNKDFADVVDLVYKRDAGIYDHLIKANRKLLSMIEGLQESGEKKSEYRKSLEARMLRRLKYEIHDCEMRKERIAFERENRTQKAKRLTFEVFASSCDCRDE